MAVSKVKLRMLYIMKILSEKSDERHTLSAADINRLLQDYGMAADRKTIYSDIETLRDKVARCRKKDCQCDPVGCIQKSSYGGRYTRVPCQPPYRTGAGQLHHPVQRGKRTGEEYSGKAHTDCPSLAHPARPLRLSGTYSQM